MAYFYCKELQSGYLGELKTFINKAGDIIIRCGSYPYEEKDDLDPKFISFSPIEAKKLIKDLNATLKCYKGRL